MAEPQGSAGAGTLSFNVTLTSIAKMILRAFLRAQKAQPQASFPLLRQASNDSEGGIEGLPSFRKSQREIDIRQGRAGLDLDGESALMTHHT